MSATRSTVALRTETVHKMIEDGDYRSPSALARAAGIAPSTLTRLLRGDTDIGAPTIAALITTTGKDFDTLFRIVESK